MAKAGKNGGQYGAWMQLSTEWMHHCIMQQTLTPCPGLLLHIMYVHNTNDHIAWKPWECREKVATYTVSLSMYSHREWHIPAPYCMESGLISVHQMLVSRCAKLTTITLLTTSVNACTKLQKFQIHLLSLLAKWYNEKSAWRSGAPSLQSEQPYSKKHALKASSYIVWSASDEVQLYLSSSQELP